MSSAFFRYIFVISFNVSKMFVKSVAYSLSKMFVKSVAYSLSPSSSRLTNVQYFYLFAVDNSSEGTCKTIVDFNRSLGFRNFIFVANARGIYASYARAFKTRIESRYGVNGDQIILLTQLITPNINFQFPRATMQHHSPLLLISL